MGSGGKICIKYLTFFFNLIFAITGIVFIAVGTVILVVYSGYNNFMDTWFFTAPVFMIIIGAVVFLVSFFGCYGAVKEHYCMLLMFSVLLFIIFILEIVAGISGYLMQREVRQMVENKMNSTMKDYSTDTSTHKSWDIMQHDLQCCGMNSASDWATAGFSDNTIPNSCCREVPKGGKCDINSIYIYEGGCMQNLQSAIEHNALILGSVGIGIAIIQITGVIFACCLARSIRREYEAVETAAH